MKLRLTGIIVLAALVGGCEDQATSRARNEEKLPPGCKIIDLDYGDLRAAIVCDGRKTTSSVRSWDEIQYVTTYGPNNVPMQTQVIYHYARISALIEPPEL